MGTYIEYFPRNSVTGLAQTLYFDIAKSEKHESSAEITEHPVERGADVADHYRPKLEKVTVEVFISNAPLATTWRPGTKTTLDLPTPNNPQKDRFGIVSILAVKQWFNPLPLIGFSSDVPTSVDMGLDASEVKGSRAELLTFDPMDAVADTIAILKKIQDDTMLCNVYTPHRTYLNMLLESWPMSRDPDDGTGASFTLSFKQVRVVETKLVAAPRPTMIRGAGGVSQGKQAGKEVGPGGKRSTLKGLANSAVGAGNVFDKVFSSLGVKL